MNDTNEKISAFYDGELFLTSEEIDELIIFINDNPQFIGANLYDGSNKCYQAS